MLIRVADSAGTAGVINPNEVQFFLRTTNSATFVGSPGFATKAYVNGGWVNLNNLANYSNAAPFRHVGTIWVGTNQSIAFRIESSGTTGFGGPTEFWLAITRATVPPAPIPAGIDTIQHTQFRYHFNGNGDGGSGILEWQIGYGYDPNTVQFTAPSSGTIEVGQFIPGSRIYIWSRGRNAVGWGPWSTRMDAQLLRGLKLKVAGTWRDVIPMIKVLGVWRVCEPYVKHAGTWKPSSV